MLGASLRALPSALRATGLPCQVRNGAPERGNDPLFPPVLLTGLSLDSRLPGPRPHRPWPGDTHALFRRLARVFQEMMPTPELAQLGERKRCLGKDGRVT